MPNAYDGLLNDPKALFFNKCSMDYVTTLTELPKIQAGIETFCVRAIHEWMKNTKIIVLLVNFFSRVFFTNHFLKVPKFLVNSDQGC